MMRSQDIRVGASYVNKSGRAERLVLDRGPHVVGCGVWEGAEPGDFNHDGEDGVLYIETRLGKSRYGAESGRHPKARYVGAFAAWARKEVPLGEEASEYTNENIIALRDTALSSAKLPRTPDWEIELPSHDGQWATWNYRLVLHEDGCLAIHEVYYDGDGYPNAATREPVGVVGDNEIEVRHVLEQMERALTMPVLDFALFDREG